MVKIKIIATGLEKNKNIKLITDEYYKRISRWAQITEEFISEVSSSATSLEQKKQKEAKLQLEKASGFIIAMDKGGEMLSSEGFAKRLETIMANGESAISFIIGGSNGLDKSVLDKANLVLSFGKITYPHEIMRICLSEQIYRAFTILNNIAYHK